MRSRRPNRVLGSPHDEFWQYCSSGEFRLQRCGTCSRVSWPPLPTCEYCQGSTLRWELMSGRGTVISWCTFERRYYDQLPIPWDTIVVELEEGPLFISNPYGFGEEDVRYGLPVEVAFLECEDEGGHFALPVFRERLGSR